MKKACYYLISFIYSTLFLNAAMSAYGQSSPRYYGAATNIISYANIKGGEFTATVNTLDSTWSTSNTQRFILHSIWLFTGPSVGWIELGFMDGAISDNGAPVSYHKGFYTANARFDSQGSLQSYTERKIIGPSTSVNSTHAFRTVYDGPSSSWKTYINGVQRFTWVTGTSSAFRVDTGLETNTANSTSAQWNERNFNTLNSTGAYWLPWESGQLVTKSSGTQVSWSTYPTAIYSSKVIP
jgi:hypothetical protein